MVAAIPHPSRASAMPGAARIRLFAEMLRRRSAIAGLPQRPDIEIIDMVTDMAAVPAETRSGSARAVFLKSAGRDPQIKNGRASGRDRGCTSVSNSVVAVT